MIKYKTGGYKIFIEKVEIKRESDFFVFFKDGSREKKHSVHYSNYFDTFQQAKKFLLKRQKQAYQRAKENLLKVEEILKTIENLKE